MQLHYLAMTLPFSIRTVFVSLPRPAKQAIAMAADAFLLFVAFHAAVWLRFEFFFLTHHYFVLSLIAVLSGIVAQAIFGVYLHVLRYMNERVIFAILGGIVVSVMAVVSVATFFRFAGGVSRGALVIYALLALVALLGMRYLGRRLLFPDANGGVNSQSRVPVAIYGAGSAGSQLAAALVKSPHYKPVALLDDDSAKHRLVTSGLRIYPPTHLDKLIRRHDVRQLLIAMPTASRKRIKEIIEQVEPYRLRVRLVPSLRELVDQSDPRRLRDLQVEDLLGRDPIAPIPDLLGRCVTGRNVMVTGAGGSIGSELCRQIIKLRPATLVLYEISEPALYNISQELATLNSSNARVISVLGSVRNEAHCMQCIRQYQINTIYHAAAYKHVPIVEQNIAEGLSTNALGTSVLAHCAIRAGVHDFVLISTDKAVRPTNIMGASKRLAELILQACARVQDRTRFCMVRFGNVLDSSGSVVPLFRKQILSGGPVTLTHPEITRYFMTIPEAAQLVLQAGSMGDSGSVYLLEMGEPIKIYDLAVRMIHMYGLTVRDEKHPEGDIEIKVVGLRPGEKLYEELLIGRDALPTQHPRIMRAQEKELSYETVISGLTNMEAAISSNDIERAVQMLKGLVPEYTPYKPEW